ncbi:uncharacterized protein LOC120636936 [Pararge aegeria]|uniref:uncharacterized protein LOC120636936 n=1 Tax=Pararge aegeria TaxID=116150 RepID=UPI0019D2A73F|nr:uncharacterized protein LOC120636936 [Pararge aegeria]
MFKSYKDITDVVSLLVYCPAERSYLLCKESNGEYWIPSSKSVKNCWNITAHQMNFELFGTDAQSQCQPIRIYKVWLPNHPKACVYHSVYKVSVKSDVKKRIKLRAGMRNRLQWFSTVELERQRAHAGLRSPELIVFAQMAVGDASKDESGMATGVLVEICEDSVLVGSEAAGGASSLASPHCQLLQAAGYCRDDQMRLYREFMLMVYPALYMSSTVFSQFMIDHGWERSQCSHLFRAADISGRGGLSFLEVLLWAAALEPNTQHAGVAAEMRCRYIFRYFDSNRDLKLEFGELKELMAAARSARQLPVDALSVARDADLVLRQLGLGSNSSLSISDFLRSVDEQHVRGTGDLLRAPSSLVDYLRDLQKFYRERELQSTSSALKPVGINQVEVKDNKSVDTLERAGSDYARARGTAGEYALATCVVRLDPRFPPEMMHLSTFDEDAVSISTARLLSDSNSLEQFDVRSASSEAFAAIHHFATAIDNTPNSKEAYSWVSAGEGAALGALLLRLAEAVRPLCMNEPRLLRLTSPVYAIGDLHGNLAALLAMAAALWPSGPALVPATLLFLGDYVDRGPHGAELMAYLFAAKLQRPDSVYLIRGNHETRDIQKMFTFHTECIAKYGEVEGAHIWNAINHVFDVLALAAVVDDKVFCCHGGIPPPWVCPLVSAIDKIPTPLPRPHDQSAIAWELLWNDPVKANKITATLALELAANDGFAANARRGAGHVFDARALERFLRANRLALVLRAHELHPHGFMCGQRGRLVSVFSSSRYCGGANESCVALLRHARLRLLSVSD